MVSEQNVEKVTRSDHEFLPVAGHPDDDECTHREDGTDATYCGLTRVEHDHHPNCYQSTGSIPEDLPADLCDCRVLRMIDAASRSTSVCRDCGEPFVPVQRGECSRCGSDAGPSGSTSAPTTGDDRG